MRLKTGMLTALLALAVGAPEASAGTYTVKSCGAPGAGGVNKAWATGYTDFNRNGHPEQFNVVSQCPGSPAILAMQSKNQAGVDATWSSTGYWELNTGTDDLRITGLTIWRWGLKFTSAEGKREWNLFASSDTGSINGEDCFLNPQGGCQTGDSTPMSGASKREIDKLNNRWVRWGITCAPDEFKSCRTAADDGGPKAGFGIWGSEATIEDAKAPATPAIGGSLVSEGWHRRSEAYEVSAGDASGIKAVALTVDGLTAQTVTQTCDELVMKSCPDATKVRLSPSNAATTIGDGEHRAILSVTDAGGNVSRVERTLRIDESAPQIQVRRPEGSAIVADATDGGSGLATAQVETRSLPDGAFGPVPTRIEGGRIVGQAAGDASKLGIRVTAVDGAGNRTVVEGLPSSVSATRAVIGGRSQAVRGGRVKSTVRRPVTLRGTLRGADGRPLGGRTVNLTATLRRSGAGPVAIGAVTTGADGRFSAVVPAGPSRQVRLEFPGGGGSLPSARAVSLRVPASSTIRASRRSVPRGTRVRFSGRLSTAGQPVPRSGKLVELQAYDRDRWRTFATTRARGRRAAWNASYRFGGRDGRYPIRVRIRRESAFPFELGYSRSIAVRVR